MTRIFHAVFPERFGAIPGIVIFHMLGGSLRELQGPAVVVLMASWEVAFNDIHTRWLMRRGCIYSTLGDHIPAYSVPGGEDKSVT